MRRFCRRPSDEETREEIEADLAMRRMWVSAWLPALVQDVRFTGRSLRRSPGFTAVALVTLALGIGSTTAVFSVVYGVLLRPLAFPNADRVVRVTALSPSRDPAAPYRSGLRAQDLQAWRDRSTTTSHIGIHDRVEATLTGTDVIAARLVGAAVSAAVFDALGTPPLIGRTFAARDEAPGAEPVVVLGHATWLSRTGADEDVVGRYVMLDNEPHRVAGVMPHGFAFPSVAGGGAPLNSEGRPADAPEFWIPLAPRQYTVYQTIALLRPGVGIEEATAEGSVILTQGRTPDGQEAPPGFRYVELTTLADSIGGRVRPVLLMFQAGVLLVLAVACMNVVNLLLARTAQRRTELSIRAALGATRGSLVRYAAVESLLLALGGGALGGLLASGVVALVRGLPPHILPRLSEIHVDGAAWLFGWALSMAVGLAVGLIAALKVTRRDIWRALPRLGRGDHPGASRQRPLRALVVVEVAATLVLLACAGLLLRSFASLLDVKPGVASERVLMFRVALPEVRYPTTVSQQAFSSSLIDALREQPGAEAAARTADGYVIDSFTATRLSSLPAPPEETTAFAWLRYVSDGYFETLGIPILNGRAFDARDRHPDSRAAIVSDTFARTYFGDADPVGRSVGWSVGDVDIIGVVGDVRPAPTAEPAAMLYLPPEQMDPAVRSALAGDRSTRVVALVRTTGDPLAFVPDARRVLEGLDPQLAAYDVMSLDQFLDRAFAGPRFYGQVAGVFAAVALVLAAVGLYGVLACSVAMRRKEFSVRMALGAQAATVAGGVMRQGLGLALAGAAIGLASAYYASRFLESLLFGVTPHDAWTYTGAAALFVLVAAIACYVPAQRATRANPIDVLRSD